MERKREGEMERRIEGKMEIVKTRRIKEFYALIA
jgi:hypothetical protein